jgi:hypothetical protein
MSRHDPRYGVLIYVPISTHLVGCSTNLGARPNSFQTQRLANHNSNRPSRLLNTGASIIKVTMRTIQRLNDPSVLMNGSGDLKKPSRMMSRNESRKHRHSKLQDQLQVCLSFSSWLSLMITHVWLHHFTDTYTTDQLVKSSVWCLTDFSGPRHTFIGIRDRAMLLMSSTLAFRGDSARNVLWSDLFSNDVPMDDIDLGAHVKVSPTFFILLPKLIVLCCRLLSSSRTMQSITRRDEQMSRALSGTASLSCVPRERSHSFSSHTSTFWIPRCLIFDLTSMILRLASMGAGIGTDSISSQARPRQLPCRMTVSVLPQSRVVFYFLILPSLIHRSP